MIERRDFVVGLSASPIFLAFLSPQAQADDNADAQGGDQRFALFVEGVYDLNLSTGKFELVSTISSIRCNNSATIYSCIAGMES